MQIADTFNAFVPGEMIIVPPKKEGQLSSLTFAVKELYDVKGFVTGAGNPRWKSTHPVAQTTAPTVELLLNEGATLLGKTISDEMAFSLDGENFHYGTPLNSRCPHAGYAGESGQRDARHRNPGIQNQQICHRTRSVRHARSRPRSKIRCLHS